MSKLTFKHGIHPNDNKTATNQLPLKQAKAPRLLYYPLKLRNGIVLNALVRPGERVLFGQKIAESEAFMSAPLHASVSGKVKEIALYLQADGQKVPTLVLENDGLDEMAPPLHNKKPEALTAGEIKQLVRKAGIVGMGGAGFPTHIKLSPKEGVCIKHVIINGAECEPYLTSDHRLMLEDAPQVVSGLLTVLRLFPEAKGYVAIEDNKPDAIDAINKAAEGLPVSVLTLEKKYPQGSEKHLIYAVTGKEVPSGRLPADVGCLVLNVDTATSISRAVFEGRPLCSRIVTLGGDAVKNPGNYITRIGTRFSDLIEHAGGLQDKAQKIIMGGPMMGMAVSSLDVPVTKGTSAILVLTEKEARQTTESPCIRCGRCVAACPMFLEPYALHAFSLAENAEKALQYHIMDCVECGCCSYSCPAKRHLVQSIKRMKQIMRQKK